MKNRITHRKNIVKVGVIFERGYWFVELLNDQHERWGIYRSRHKEKAIPVAEKFATFSGLDMIVHGHGETWVL